MEHDKNISTYSFDKGTGFVVIKEEDAIQKIEKQIGKSKVIDHNPSPTLLNKFQKELAKLRKGNKFDNKTHFKYYPSDATPPRLTGVIKAHKPEKNYPLKTIVSTIGTAPYRTSKYLVEIIRPTLNKNKHRVMNSSSFVNEAATWETTQEEIQVSYDVISLYPSIPIDKVTIVLIDTLNNDLDDLNTHSKLKPTDIHKLTELWLSKSHFRYENKIRLLKKW